jgi:hypothetical protein
MSEDFKAAQCSGFRTRCAREEARLARNRRRGKVAALKAQVAARNTTPATAYQVARKL